MIWPVSGVRTPAPGTVPPDAGRSGTMGGMRSPPRRDAGSEEGRFGGVRRRLGVALVVVALTASGTAAWYHRHRPPMSLYAATVALDAGGSPVLVSPADAGRLLPGSRVLRPADPARLPAAEALAAGQQRWLDAGTVPGAGTAYEPMVRAALLDMRTLTLPNGATVASWYGSWGYVWPRDASFVAVAMARTGHLEDAVGILTFLESVQPPDGVFEARYRPDDGTAVDDGRDLEPDGAGWALWATAEVARAAGDRAAQHRVLVALRALITRSTEAALRLTDTATSLPAPALDYWEVPEHTLTLGVVAPLLAGLQSAEGMWAALGDASRAGEAHRRRTAVAAAVADAFGPHYPRHLGRGAADTDAAVTFLLPPFVDTADPDVERARQAAVPAMRRPAGGLAPGAAWPDDGLTWTPETALFALAAASGGRDAEAREWLDVLLDHRTAAGSLPEKVTADGTPAATAPLAWTGACVVLAVVALTAHP